MKVLPFDPIEEARRQWVQHGWFEAADGMAIITSIMRVQQIYLARIDAVLRSFDLSFARFELLSLISLTRTGALPLSKVGARLQVHPTSVTSAVDRLEAQGFVCRLPHKTDRRMTLVEIRPIGRAIVGEATLALNEKVFAALGLSVSDMEKIFVLLRNVREAEGDFAT